MAVICTDRSAMPVWLAAWSGHSAEKPSFPQTVPAEVAPLQTRERPCFSADRALDSADTLTARSAVSWITRVPDTSQEARDLLPRLEPAALPPSAHEGDRDGEVTSPSGGVPPRWLVVVSQQASDREATPCQPQGDRHPAHAPTPRWPLSPRECATPEAARVAVAALEKSWRGHRAEVQREPVAHDGRRGRPRTEEAPPPLRWRVVGRVVPAPAAIAAALQRTGKFVVATTAGEAARWPAETSWSAYQAQGLAVARGFRFLKDPRFCADSRLVTRPERLRAWLMGMGVARLVEALAEHTVRTALVRGRNSWPHQPGNPTQPPTRRWIFPLLEGIAVLWLRQPAGVQRHVLHLQPRPRHILTLLGPEVQPWYSLDG